MNTKISAKSFVTTYSDDEAMDWLVVNNVYDDVVARAVVTKWRKIASDLGYTGPVAWKVRSGFTLKQHAPYAGRCYDELNYLQSWNLRNDESTKESFNFWIPRIAEVSTGKTISQMETLRNELRVRYELPTHHCTSFGSIALLFALVLHFNGIRKRGERFKSYYMVSDTLHVGGHRLVLGFRQSYLYCDVWHERDNETVGFGFLGVEFSNLGV